MTSSNTSARAVRRQRILLVSCLALLPLALVAQGGGQQPSTALSPGAAVAIPFSGPGWQDKVLNYEGYVMPPLDPRMRSTPVGQVEEPLPLMTGLNTTELQSTRKRVESVQSLAALQLIQKFEESFMSTVVDLKRVDVSSPEVMVATTSRGSEITFTTQDIDQQLLRWREIYEKGMRYNRDIATLDLAVTNNIPARWMEASLEPPQPPRRTPKTPRNSPTTRKRNV